MPPARKTIGLSELRVGILVLASVAILIFLILNATGDINPFARKLHLKAQFSNADGLRPGAEVRLAGVRVGKVEEVLLLPPPPTDDPKAPRIEARLSVNGTIDGKSANERIRQDSVAQLTSPGLLGNDKIINITPGTAASSPVPEGYTLSTTSANTFTDLASSGNDLVQRLSKVSDQVNEITKKINEGRGTLGRIVNDEALYNNLNAAIRDAQEVIRQIRAGEGSAGKFVNDPALYNNLNDAVVQMQAIAKDIRAGRGTAGKLFTDDALYNEARSTFARLNETADKINLIVADVRSGKGTAGKLITDEAIYNDARTAIARFNTAAERIDNVVASAQRGEGTVGKLLTDDSLYNNVNQFSSEGVKLLYDFRQNPKKYLTVKFELF